MINRREVFICPRAARHCRYLYLRINSLDGTVTILVTIETKSVFVLKHAAVHLRLMENNSSHPPTSPLTTKAGDLLAGLADPISDASLSLVAASMGNAPELTLIKSQQLSMGDDGLIRLAVWTASRACSSLRTARNGLLLIAQGGLVSELRCDVLACVNLHMPRPLSGFLLRPTVLVDGHGLDPSRDRPFGAAGSTGHYGNEMRLALLNAFPVNHDREPLALSG